MNVFFAECRLMSEDLLLCGVVTVFHSVNLYSVVTFISISELFSPDLSAFLYTNVNE